MVILEHPDAKPNPHAIGMDHWRFIEIIDKETNSTEEERIKELNQRFNSFRDRYAKKSSSRSSCRFSDESDLTIYQMAARQLAGG